MPAWRLWHKETPHVGGAEFLRNFDTCGKGLNHQVDGDVNHQGDGEHKAAGCGDDADHEERSVTIS